MGGCVLGLKLSNCSKLMNFGYYLTRKKKKYQFWTILINYAIIPYQFPHLEIGETKSVE